MNITNGSLYRTIKTMNAQEQKEFTEQLEQSNAAGGVSQYLHLFNLLCSLTAYDERKIKAQLSRQIPTGSFAVVKNHLREKLMRYLITRQPDTGRNQGHLMLMEVEMLYHRQLYYEAEEMCNKVIKLGEQHEIYIFIMEANGWLLLLLPHTTHSNYDKKTEEITARSLLYTQRMELGFALRQFSEHILGTTFQNSDNRSRKMLNLLEQQLQHPLMQTTPNDHRLTPSSRVMYEIARMQIFRMLGRVEEAFSAQQTVMDIFLKDWKFYVKNKRADCLAVVTNYFGVVSLTTHFKAYAQHLIFVEKLLKTDFKNHYRLQLFYTLNKFLYHVLKDKANISPIAVANYEKFYLAQRSTLPIDQRTVFSIVYSFATYQTRQYQKGMDALQYEMNEYRRAQVREDQLEDFQISFLMHYFLLQISKRWNQQELHEFEMRVTTLYHSFRKKTKDEDYRFELCLIKLFRHLKPASTKKQLLAEAIKTEKELDKLFKSPYPSLVIVAATFDYKDFITRCKNYLS